MPITRRTVLAFAALSPAVSHAVAAGREPLNIVVTRDPSCGCCGAWVDHLRAHGFTAKVVETTDLNRVKARLGVPAALHSCHTAEIGRYAIEGHVPAAAIKRLLAEAPDARGLAVPGMPIGSPGMEVEAQAPETYAVVLFGPSGQRVFARFKGSEEIKS